MTVLPDAWDCDHHPEWADKRNLCHHPNHVPTPADVPGQGEVEGLLAEIGRHVPYYGNQPANAHAFTVALGCACGSRWGGFGPEKFGQHRTEKIADWLAERDAEVARATLLGAADRWADYEFVEVAWLTALADEIGRRP